MNLRHVVVTCVTRDDLDDGGASQFAATIRELRVALPDAAVEVLTSDFRGNMSAVRTVVEARPDPRDAEELLSIAAHLARGMVAEGADRTPEARRLYGDEALAMLRRAVAAGLRAPALRNSRDLDPLCSRPDFQLLLLDLAFPARPFP